MSKKLKGYTWLVSGFLILTLILSGCTESEESGINDTSGTPAVEESATNEEANTSGAENEEGTAVENEKRTIVDNSGNSVTIPAVEDINRVVILSPPLLSMYYAMGASMNNLVGITPTAVEAAKAGVFYDICPELDNIRTDYFVNGSQVNVEEFLKMRPDVGLYYSPKQGAVFSEVTVPGLSFMGDQIYDPFETISIWASLMAEVMGTETEGEEIIAYGDRVLNDVREKAALVPEEDKLKGMFIHSYANGKISVGGSEFYADFWLTEAGMINVANEAIRPHQVDIEQIYEWNPDIIFIWNGTSAEDILANNVEGHDWSDVQAVKDGRVYSVPSGIFDWYPVGSDTALMMEWVAQTAYPEIFNYDLRQDTYDYYQEIYDYELSEDQITRILDGK
jgi:iron complex transport system substrate-binding protein